MALRALKAHILPKPLGAVTTFHGTVALTLVIPTGAKGPVVPRTFNESIFLTARSILPF